MILLSYKGQKLYLIFREIQEEACKHKQNTKQPKSYSLEACQVIVFLQTKESRQNDKKGHLERYRPRGWIPSPRTLHFCDENIKKKHKNPLLKIIEAWR